MNKPHWLHSSWHYIHSIFPCSGAANDEYYFQNQEIQPFPHHCYHFRKCTTLSKTYFPLYCQTFWFHSTTKSHPFIFHFLQLLSSWFLRLRWNTMLVFVKMWFITNQTSPWFDQRCAVVFTCIVKRMNQTSVWFCIIILGLKFGFDVYLLIALCGNDTMLVCREFRNYNWIKLSFSFWVVNWIDVPL